MAKRIVHMCLDLRGALKNWRSSEWVGVVTHEGRKLTPGEVQDAFIEALAAGKRVVPLGDPCEGWSDQTGCPGHEGEE